MIVGILVDAFFLGNESGINTFVKHTCRMFRNNDVETYLLLDGTITDERVEKAYLDMGVKIWSDQGDLVRYHTKEHDEQAVLPSFERLLVKFKELGPSLVLANSYVTTQAITAIDMGDCKKATQTHIGDVMSLDHKDKWDFSTSQDFIDLLNSDKVDLICQTDGVRTKHLEVLDKRTKAFVCHEAYFESNFTHQLRKVREGAICIAGNYKRKNIEQVIDLCAQAHIPLTILTTCKDSPDRISLDLYAKQEGCKFNIIEKLGNQFVTSHIKSHKIMIHMADIEVCPYSVIEALPHIPCIIKDDVPWTHNFFKQAIKIEKDDYKAVLEVYNNSEKYDTLDLKEYQETAWKQWSTYINSK